MKWSKKNKTYKKSNNIATSTCIRIWILVLPWSIPLHKSPPRAKKAHEHMDIWDEMPPHFVVRWREADLDASSCNVAQSVQLIQIKVSFQGGVHKKVTLLPRLQILLCLSYTINSTQHESHVAHSWTFFFLNDDNRGIALHAWVHMLYAYACECGRYMFSLSKKVRCCTPDID